MNPVAIKVIMWCLKFKSVLIDVLTLLKLLRGIIFSCE